MDFNFSYSGAPDESVAVMFAAIWIVVMLVCGAVGIAVYIFRSLAVYTVAKRRGLNRPWLAWIPVASDYLLGSISDQYKYLTQGKNQSRRKVLLGLSIGVTACGVLCVGVCIGLVVKVVTSIYGWTTDAQLAAAVMGPVLSVMGISLVMSIVSIVWMVFYYMCKYDLYKSCDPKNAVAYLVLSILFNILDPIFLMVVRNKDLGMPPRKPEPVPEYYQPQRAPQTPPVQEPWEQ